MDDLPVLKVLPTLLETLEKGTGAVLVAPPGAGKTTAVAPALLTEDWCTGEILLLSPRRVAARAAAERMSELLGERAGETIGYATRLDSKRSARTRVTVVTEAIFVNRIVDDPELEGISAVLFDEAHERNLDTDLGFAFALESRSVLRPDLRILVMSATIDGARFADLLGSDAPVIESAGRSFPLRIEWLDADPSKSIEDAVVSAVRQAWHSADGDILAFLPGLREITRAVEKLEGVFPDAPVLPLHGQVDGQRQRQALLPDPQGRRRIVVASAIAETSLTLHGVRIVVDSGLSRQAVFDPVGGATRLETVRSSQASTDQRAGRAARQGPGVAFRMWNRASHGGRPAFSPPDMETADLAPLILTLARWGTRDPTSLQWLDEPPESAVASARERLTAMQALDETGHLTSHGSRLASLPMDPVSAAAVLAGAMVGQAEDAARLVVLLQERGLGGHGEDLARRLDRWNGDRGKRASAARALASRWARSAEKLVDSRPAVQPVDPAIFLARARPAFIARRRSAQGEHWRAASGRGYRLDPESPLSRCEWIVIGDAQGHPQGARITSAIALAEKDIDEHLGDLMERRSHVAWNDSTQRVEPRHQTRMGAIVVRQGHDEEADEEAILQVLMQKALTDIDGLLPPELIHRARYAGIGELSADRLPQTADLWLAPMLRGRRDLLVGAGRAGEAVLGMLDWPTRQRLDHDAPCEFVSPAGTRHIIDYSGPDAPSTQVRVQAMFGLDTHPMIGKTPLLLKLTSPAGSPVQATRDLPAFWRGSWSDVRKDMKGRYPKHRWPEEPWTEAPSLKTKNAFSRASD